MRVVRVTAVVFARAASALRWDLRSLMRLASVVVVGVGGDCDGGGRSGGEILPLPGHPEVRTTTTFGLERQQVGRPEASW